MEFDEWKGVKAFSLFLKKENFETDIHMKSRIGNKFA